MTAFIYAGLPLEIKWNFNHQVKVSEPLTILNAVSSVLDIPTEVITSSLRTKDVSEARCIAIALIIKSNQGLRLQQIGKMFNRHHATIMYNRELFDNLNGSDRDFTAKVESVRRLV